MTRQTTALLTAGPKRGVWGDRIWRLSLTAQLVEGGAAAYWLVSATPPANHEVQPPEIVIEVPESECVLDSIYVLLGAHLGNDEIAGFMEETHNISVTDNVREIAPYWDLSLDAREELRSWLSAQLRLGVTFMDSPSLFTEEVVEKLRKDNFDIDVFALKESHLELD